MKKFVLIFSLVFSVISFAQSSNEFSSRLFPQGYGIKLLNSSGTSSIINDISNLGFMNPASISEFENYSLGFSYQFNASIYEAWIADFGTSRVYNFYPQSAGGIVKWNDFTFGLGFGQKYNGTIDTDPIPVSTVQNPDSIVDYITPISETIIHSYSFTVSYSFKDFFQTSNNISLALRYNLNRYRRYNEIWDVTGNATDYFGNFAFGLYSSFNLDDQRKLLLGLSYEMNSEYRAKIEIDSELLLIDIDPNRPPNYVMVDQYYYGNTAPEIRFDLAIDATTQLKFLSNLTSVFWKTETNALKDQIEFSFSTIYKINEMFTPSIGFYYSDYKFENNYYSQLNSELNSFFITAGLRLNIQNYFADLAIADSHLFSGDFRKQTIAKLAVGITL